MSITVFNSKTIEIFLKIWHLFGLFRAKTIILLNFFFTKFQDRLRWSLLNTKIFINNYEVIYPVTCFYPNFFMTGAVTSYINYIWY